MIRINLNSVNYPVVLCGKHPQCIELDKLTNYDFFYLISVMKFLLADRFDFFSSNRQCLPIVRIFDVKYPARHDLESNLVKICDKNR